MRGNGAPLLWRDCTTLGGWCAIGDVRDLSDTPGLPLYPTAPVTVKTDRPRYRAGRQAPVAVKADRPGYLAGGQAPLPCRQTGPRYRAERQTPFPFSHTWPLSDELVRPTLPAITTSSIPRTTQPLLLLLSIHYPVHLSPNYCSSRFLIAAYHNSPHLLSHSLT